MRPGRSPDGPRPQPNPAPRRLLHLSKDCLMTDTIISSATREVVIGFDRPFVIIGVFVILFGK